ncbi:MAG TPA: hypothetical protein VD913_01670 [bacterium]|nr:hypothetical protein [bacterium]
MRKAIREVSVFIFIGVALATGCASRKDKHLRYLVPFDRENLQTPGSAAQPYAYEKEKNGIHVSAMTASGKNRLLILSVAVSNWTNHPINVSPNKVFLAVNRGFLIPPMSAKQVVNKRLHGSGGGSFPELAGNVPYNDPYKIGSALSSASSVYRKQGQMGRGDLEELAGKRMFRASHLPPGFATQGLLYYDPVGYDIQKDGFPVTVLLEVESEKFIFEFMPESSKTKRK